MKNLMLLVLGVFVSVLGAVNLAGNISTIHSYNRRKVREEDIPKYGKAVGMGTLVIGVSMIVAFGLSFLNETLIAAIVLPAFAVGTGFILYAQFKYNHGIF